MSGESLRDRQTRFGSLMPQPSLSLLRGLECVSCVHVNIRQMCPPRDDTMETLLPRRAANAHKVKISGSKLRNAASQGILALCRGITLASAQNCGDSSLTYLTIGNCVLQILSSGVVGYGRHCGRSCCEVVRKSCGLRAWAQCDKTGFVG